MRDGFSLQFQLKHKQVSGKIVPFRVKRTHQLHPTTQFARAHHNYFALGSESHRIELNQFSVTKLITATTARKSRSVCVCSCFIFLYFSFSFPATVPISIKPNTDRRPRFYIKINALESINWWQKLSTEKFHGAWRMFSKWIIWVYKQQQHQQQQRICVRSKCTWVTWMWF